MKKKLVTEVSEEASARTQRFPLSAGGGNGQTARSVDAARTRRLAELVGLILAVYVPFMTYLAYVSSNAVKALPTALILLLSAVFLIERRFRLKLLLPDYLLLLFLAFAAISTLLVNRVPPWYFFKQLFAFFPIYLLYFVLRETGLALRAWKRIVRALQGSATLLSVLAMVEVASNKRLMYPLALAKEIYRGSNFDRAYSLLLNPNIFAAFLLLVFLITFALYYYQGVKTPLFIPSLWLAALLLSGSRTTLVLAALLLLLGLPVCLFRLFLRHKAASIKLNKAVFSRLLRRGLVPVLCLVLAFSLYGLTGRAAQSGDRNFLQPSTQASTGSSSPKKPTSKPGATKKPTSKPGATKKPTNVKPEQTGENSLWKPLLDRFSVIFSDEFTRLSLADGRLFAINKGLLILREHPLWGTGLGTFGSAASLSWEPPSYRQQKIFKSFYADNQYISLLVECGIPGFLLLAGFFLSLFFTRKNCWRAFPVFFSFLWFGLFFNMLEFLVLAFIFYLTMAYQAEWAARLERGLPAKLREPERLIPLLQAVYRGNKSEYQALLAHRLEKKLPLFVVTANPESFMHGLRHEGYAKILADSQTLVVPDGIAVIKAVNQLGIPLRERITGVDSLMFILEYANAQHLSLAFFGGSQEVSQKIVCLMAERYPGAELRCCYHGYLPDRAAVMEEIVQAQADCVFLALGIPEQEILLYRYADRLPHSVVMGVGGAFDVLTGQKKRAPQFFIRLNLEWLYRIAFSPKRWRRFWNNNVEFFSVLRRARRAASGQLL